jgi:hypothetical protein
VPCPFFLPVSRLVTDEWIHAPRLPLDAEFRGVCKAQPDDPFVPSESAQRELCNCGYARGRCTRLPQDSADAIRFSVACESASVIRIVWIVERAHAPAEFGTLAYFDGKITAPSCAAAPLLAEQAKAFVRGGAGFRPAADF